MARRILIFVLAVSISVICGGCLHKKPGVRVVEQICVQWEENGHPVCREHGDPEKMQLILNRLRTLGQRFSSETDPETLDAPTVTVTLLYSDDSSNQYQIKPDRYVRIGQAPWQQANPKQITSLRLLLLSLPGDSGT